jgi:hypothetical protein
MDEIVKQAMAKWPNVPHCYGWLALDARGAWRMRDAAARRAGTPGDKLANVALVGFINRNYARDARGCWYFQNGPQRVYVNLEATPFIARTDPQAGLLLHTGQALPAIERAFIGTHGEIIVQHGAIVAQLDDRDAAPMLALLECDGAPAQDEALLHWLETGAGSITLRFAGAAIPVERIESEEIAGRFQFVRTPLPD